MISQKRIEKLIKEKIPKDSQYQLDKLEVIPLNGEFHIVGEFSRQQFSYFTFKVSEEEAASDIDYEALCAQRVVYQMEKVFHPEKELDFIMKMLENEKSNS